MQAIDFEALDCTIKDRPFRGGVILRVGVRGILRVGVIFPNCRG